MSRAARSPGVVGSLAMLLAALAGSGCAGKLEPWTVLRESDPAGLLEADALLPLRTGTSAGVDARADASAGQLVIEVSESREHGATHAISFEVERDGRREPERTEFVRGEPGRGVVLVAVLDHVERALTHFESGLVLAPRALEPSTPVRSTSRVRVVDSASGARRAAGHAVMTVTRLPDAVVAHEAGERTLARVSIAFEARLGPARADDETILWLDDAGLLARQESRRVVVLGVVSRSRRAMWLLRG